MYAREYAGWKKKSLDLFRKIATSPEIYIPAINMTIQITDTASREFGIRGFIRILDRKRKELNDFEAHFPARFEKLETHRYAK